MKNNKYIFISIILFLFSFIGVANALNLSAPSPVTNFTGTATTNSVNLTWDTPNEPSLAEFELRYSTSPITSGNFNVATQVSGVISPVSGTNQTAQVPGLNTGTTYYFGIKIIGANGSYSSLTATSVTTTTTGGGGGGTVCTKPSPLSDITFSSTKNSIDISWRTSPESGLSEFDIRYSTSSLNFANFLFGTKVTTVSTPITNEYQTTDISGLDSDTTYYFGLAVLNACGSMSDPVFVSIKTKAQISAPSPVTNFTGTATTNSVNLTWDTPNEPSLAEFELRYSTSPITSGNFNVATQVSGVISPVSGTNQTAQVPGLNTGTTYYFGIKIIGANGSYSSLTATSVTTTNGGGGCTSNCGGGGSSGLVIIGGGGNAFNPSSIIINNGDIVTFNRLVNLKISSNGATKMLLSNYKDFVGATWVPYNTTSTWILLPKIGSKTIYARFKNLTSEIKNYVSDKIFLITTAPAPIPAPIPVPTPIKTPLANAGIGPWFSILPDNVLIPNKDDFDIVVIAHAGENSTNYFAKMKLIYPKDLVEFKSITYNKGWIPKFNESDNNNDIKNGVLIKTANYPKGFRKDNVFAVITFSVKNRGEAIFRFSDSKTISIQKTGEHKFKYPTQSSLSIVDKKPKGFFANIFDAVSRFFLIFK